MNELQVETIKLKPAVIEFNHEEIEEELRKNLAKYEGLTFTSDATTELRKVRSELNKGKNAVDEYRKKVKRELNEPVKAFEDTCKELNTRFDNVIKPLDAQLKAFVEQERAEKLEQLEKARDEYIIEHGLADEYVDRIEIEDSFLNKSTSLKMASESIEFQVKNLKMEQEKFEADKEVISTTVKLANAENELSFSTDAYLRLLEFDDVEVVKRQIEKDVVKEMGRRKEQERLEQLRREREAQEERIAAQKKQEVIDSQEIESKNEVDELIEEESEQAEAPSLPFGDIDELDSDEIDLGYESVPAFNNYVYSINANEEQLEKLHEFMDENNISWRVQDETI